MSNYKGHTVFNMLIGFPIGAFCFYYFISRSHTHFAIFSTSFLLSTLFFSPDLDILHSVRITSLRGIVTLPFRPYSYLFQHRGISHFPIIGTLTRILYIGILALLCASVYNQKIPTIDFVHQLYLTAKVPLFIAFAGLTYGDFCHLVLDRGT